MRWVVFAILVLGAHFSLAAVAPARAGRAWVGWPFAADTETTIPMLASLSRPLTILLGILGGAAFLAAAFATAGWLVPAGWWPGLVVAGASASGLLYLLHFGVLALIPLAIDGILLWAVLAWAWTASVIGAG